MTILLVRSYHDKGTNGELFFNGIKICDTIELPWKDNQRRISCIPEGNYTLRKRYTVKFRWHCWVNDVPDRDGILIHAFNNALLESKGCIAPVSKLTGVGEGEASRLALNELLDLLEPAFSKNRTVCLVIKKKQK